jgi:hypothetical protein
MSGPRNGGGVLANSNRNVLETCDRTFKLSKNGVCAPAVAALAHALPRVAKFARDSPVQEGSWGSHQSRKVLPQQF